MSWSRGFVSVLVFLLSVASDCHGQHRSDSDRTRSRSYDDGRWFLSVSGRFEVIDDSYLVIYRQPGFYKTAGHVFYYFSESLESPIYPLKVRHLKMIVDNEDLLAALRRNRNHLEDIVDGRARVNVLLGDGVN